MAYTADDVHNAIVDATGRGASITAERLRAQFPDDHELNQFMMSVLIGVMRKPPQMVQAVAQLDNAVNALLGKQPVIDPLLSLWDDTR